MSMTEKADLTMDYGAAFKSTLAASPAFQEIENKLSDKGSIIVCGADGAQKAWIEEALRQKGPAILIVPDHKDLMRWEEDIHFFSPDAEILYFPIVEKADFAVTFTGTEALRGRMQALSALMNGRPVIVSHPPAFSPSGNRISIQEISQSGMSS